MRQPALARLAASVALAALASACGGGEGNVTFTAYFGVNGLGSCDGLVLDLDLERSGAVLELEQREPACRLRPFLEALGCNLDLNEIHDGATLRARISGCTTPPSTELLECDFQDGVPLLIQAATDVTCECESPGCATLPPVCVALNPDPAACENCGNGRDDDGDGHTDCDDANCRFSDRCEGTTTTTVEPTTTTTVMETTTTSSSTTSTTEGTGSTTTTTVPSSEADYLVRFRLDSASTSLGALQLSINYAAATGAFVGAGAEVECTSLVTGALFAPFHDGGAKVLNLGFVALTPFSAPTDVAECVFKGDSSDALVAGDLVVTVEDATNGDGEPATAAMSASVTGTAATTTTTTLPPAAVDYLVRYRLDSASTSLGALQLSTNYATATGTFAGAGAAVECTSLVAGALFAPFHDGGARVLNLGFVALTPFSAPTDVAECVFEGESGDAPVPGDLAVTVEDATNGDGEPATAAVSVSVVVAP